MKKLLILLLGAFMALNVSATSSYSHDEAEAEFLVNFKSYELKDNGDGSVLVTAQDENRNHIELDITLPEATTYLAPGTYPIVVVGEDDDYPYQSVTAGSYDEENNKLVPSYAAVWKENGQFIEKVWYIVSGYMFVKENMDIAVSANNSLGKRLACVLHPGNVTPTEPTDQDLAKEVITLIGNIGDVKYTNGCKGKIDAARNAYDALTDEQKALVSNYDTLTAAEAAYKAMKKAGNIIEWGESILRGRSFSTANATTPLYVNNDNPFNYDMRLILYKGNWNGDESVWAANGGSDLQSVFMRFDNLDSSLIQIDMYYTYSVDIQGDPSETWTYDEWTDNNGYITWTGNKTSVYFTGTIRGLSRIVFTAFEKEVPAEVKNVIDLIKAIGEVAYTDECKQKIDAAREAYDALTDEQKELVSNYDTLIAAEAAYAELKADYTAAKAVIDLIDAIGVVTYSDASKEKIDAAREAYDALTDEQKELVTNYDVLVAAEERYAFLIPIELTVTGVEVQLAKFADGKTDAVVTKQGVLNGVVKGDSVTLTTTAAFNDAAAGEHKTITVKYVIEVVQAEKNYVLKVESATYSTDGTILEPMAADDEAQPETEEGQIQNGIEVDGYGYCDGSSYSLKYHLKSGNPDQYKIDFADSRFTNVAWTNLTKAGADGTIEINVPVDIPTGDYTMDVTFRDSRYTFIESKPFTASIHVNLPETYVVVLFDNVMAVVDTCQCLTDIQWYHRNNSSEAWAPIDGATGYYYRQEGGLTGEYFIHAKVNGQDTYTCPQTDVKTLYGNNAQKAQVRINPNPVVNTAVVTIEGADTFDHDLRIINTNGWEVENRNFEGNTTTIDMSGCQVGNYMISVDGIVVKVIKQ